VSRGNRLALGELGAIYFEPSVDSVNLAHRPVANGGLGLVELAEEFLGLVGKASCGLIESLVVEVEQLREFDEDMVGQAVIGDAPSLESGVAELRARFGGLARLGLFDACFEDAEHRHGGFNFVRFNTRGEGGQERWEIWVRAGRRWEEASIEETVKALGEINFTSRMARATLNSVELGFVRKLASEA
jgi:hypothetical protein